MNDLAPVFPEVPRQEFDATTAGALLAARYRDKLPAPNTWNETLDVLLSHRSVRAYLPDALPEGTVETLVTAAQSAASSSNLQAWSVIAVEDQARKSRLAALAGHQKHIEEAPLLLVWLVDLNRLEKLATAQGKTSRRLRSIISKAFCSARSMPRLPRRTPLWRWNRSGWAGFISVRSATNRWRWPAELGLPPHVFALFGLVVGRPDPKRPTDIKPRLPQRAVFFREQYGFGEAGLLDVAAYDQRFQAFQREQGLPELGWSAQAGKRVRDAASLNGRDVLSDALHLLGFGLK